MSFHTAALNGRAGLLAALLFLQPALPAHAALGRAYSSVEADRSHLGATSSSAASGAYVVHTLTLANQGVVKEFTNTAGTVFAVAWRAPGRPDLEQLLGDHFATLQAGNVRFGRRRRAPLAVNQSDLVVQSGGHPGAFWGVAILPKIQPAGFTAADLK